MKKTDFIELTNSLDIGRIITVKCLTAINSPFARFSGIYKGVEKMKLILDLDSSGLHTRIPYHRIQSITVWFLKSEITRMWDRAGDDSYAAQVLYEDGKIIDVKPIK